MNLDQARSILVLEARELLAEMDAALLQIESHGQHPEQINALFRAAHTIKGSAGIFALSSLVDFAHVLESVLEQVRAGQTRFDPALLSLLLRCGDYLGSLVSNLEQGREGQEPNALLRAQLLEALMAYLAPPAGAVEAAGRAEAIAESGREPAHELATESASEAVTAQPPEQRWHISLRPYADALRNGLDPLSFLRYLSKQGAIVSLHTLTEHLPAASEFDAESSYLGYELEFLSRADQVSIEAAFEFIRDDSLLVLVPPNSPLSAYEQLLKRLPEPRERLLEIFQQGGAISAEQRAQLQVQTLVSTPAVGRQKSLSPAPTDHELRRVMPPDPADKPARTARGFVKVEVGKLDELINLVGELVIAGAAADMAMEQSACAPLKQAHEVLSGLLQQVRDVSLSLRMVAVGEVFQRLPRVVRDLSQTLEKDVELVITGADTELDKSMVERLAEPLLHIVRNALDHGIERAAQRLAGGKRARGVLRVHAYHESASIVLEVTDDGRGLDRPRIIAKAIEQGLLSAQQQPSEYEVDQLIFAPGFSTAAQVTQLSGRGVGMDVVRSHIERLRGKVEVFSQPGLSTCVRIRLPLTLAIIDGFQVCVGAQAYVLPLAQVVECVDLAQHRERHAVFNLRGEPLPFVRLRSLLGLPAPVGIRESLLVLHVGNLRAGLVVDQLMGELQAVIKPLGPLFSHNALLSGSTILGDGSVALILDVTHLIQRAVAHSAAYSLKQTPAVDAPAQWGEGYVR